MAESGSRVTSPHEGNGEAGCDPANLNYAEIIVVRHGETAWNHLGKIQGHLDVELNDIGRQQASAVADHLSKEPNISAVYSSDLKRALETAKEIAKSCGGIEVIEDQDLRERHLGDLQGHVHSELAIVCPTAYQAFTSKRADIEIPGGGESRDQLYRRSVSALQRIGEKHRGERVVVVSHGGFIRSLHRRASRNGGRTGRVQNTSISIFLLYDNGNWVIKKWNDISHLSSTAVLSSGFGGDNYSG